MIDILLLKDRTLFLNVVFHLAKCRLNSKILLNVHIISKLTKTKVDHKRSKKIIEGRK